MLEIFQELNESGITLIMVTHEEEVSHCAKRVIRFSDGKLVKDELIEKQRKADANSIVVEQ